MNLLEAKEILKDNGYYVNKLNECGYSWNYDSCGTPYYHSSSSRKSSSRRSTNHMKPEELEARRAKIAANKEKLDEFEKKQLPKLAKLFNVSKDDVRAFRDGSKINAYVSLGDGNELKLICPDGKPEFFHINYEGFDFGGRLSELKSTINTVEKIGDLLKSFAKIK